jgi:hypothetical protein
MKIQIKNISIVQTSKVVAILYAVFGLIFVPIGCCVITIGLSTQESQLTVAGITYLFFPLIYLIFGFLAMAFLFWIYNLIAGRLGGIEFEMEEIEVIAVQNQPSPAPGSTALE